MKPIYIVCALTMVVAVLYAWTRDPTLGTLTCLCIGGTLGMSFRS